MSSDYLKYLGEGVIQDFSHKHIHAYPHKHTCMLPQTHMHACLHKHTCMHACTNTYAYMPAETHTCMPAQTHAWLHTSIMENE